MSNVKVNPMGFRFRFHFVGHAVNVVARRYFAAIDAGDHDMAAFIAPKVQNGAEDIDDMFAIGTHLGLIEVA